MSVGISDNITTLYQLQQNAIQSENNQKSSCAPAKDCSKKDLTSFQKAGIGLCTGVGVIASLMLLAKFDKSKAYTINPLKMFKGSIKDSYLLNAKYKTKEIVTMGIGSILGGLVGGKIFDKNEDSNTKLREGIVQIANITFPIALVEGLSYLGTKSAEKFMPNWSKSKNFLKQAVTKFPPALGAGIGLITGMYIGNRCSNKFNEKVFHKKDDRPMKWKDFSAHVDDIGVAATFVAPDNFITKSISRLIPAALLVAGYETGTKKENK